MLISSVNVQAQLEYPSDYTDWQSDPTIFYENKGQLKDSQNVVRNDIKYYTTAYRQNVFLFDNADISFVKVDAAQDTIDPDTLRRLDFRLTGERNEEAPLSAVGKSTDYRNYYLPHCASGATYCHAYKKFTYADIYPKIDMEVRAIQAYAKFYFVAKPGSSPSDIEFEFEGQDQIDIYPYLLEIFYGSDEMTISNAIAYQEYNGTITPLSWSPVFLNQRNGKVGFSLGTYDNTKNLIIQMGSPLASFIPSYGDNNDWTTYYGGSLPETGFRIAETSNLIYFSGNTLSDDLPLYFSTNYDYYYSDAVNNAPNYYNGLFGSRDCFLVGVNPNTLEPMTSTYYGGNNGYTNGNRNHQTSNDYCFSIGVDKVFNRLYMVGKTQSSFNFPLRDFNPYSTIDYYDDNFNGNLGDYDAFIARFRQPNSVVLTESLIDKYQLEVYPNPASDYINLKLNSGSFTKGYIRLYSVHGQLIKEQIIFSETALIDISKLEKGNYFLNIELDSKFTTKSIQIF